MGKAAPATALDDDRQMECWSDTSSKFDVSQSPEDGGLLYSLAVHARVESSPDQLFAILTDPDSAAIFRGIKECTLRQLVEERGAVRQWEVCHRATTRFLFLTVNFDTSLHVWEDSENKTIRFKMARTGFMRRFDGMWSIRPFTQASLDDLARARSGQPPVVQPQQHKPSWLNPSAIFQSLMHPGGSPASAEAPPQASLVSLEQALLPRATAPPGLRYLVRGLCLKQVREMVEDLKLEVARRQAQGDARPKATEARRRDKKRQAALLPAATSAAACISSGGLLWTHTTPITITIQL